MKYKYSSTIIIIGFILCLAVLSIFKEDQLSSDLEGRTYEQLPIPNIVKKKLGNTNEVYAKQNEDESSVITEADRKEWEETKDGILSGAYFKQWDSYFSDQLIGRSNFFHAYMTLQEAKDTKLINGVYVGDENYLFSERELLATKKDLKERAAYFEDFASFVQPTATYAALIPSKELVNDLYHPIKGYSKSMNEAVDTLIANFDTTALTPIDVRAVLQDQAEQNFFKTDHHLNMNGVFKGYEFIISAIEKDFPEVGQPMKKNDFIIKTFHEKFVGAEGRKVGFLVDDFEDIEVYKIKEKMNYEVYINEKKSPLFFEKQIQTDKFNNDYKVYLNGDHAEIKIMNHDAPNDLTIAVIGDSMDNPLIPLFIPHFNTIHSMDLRHFKRDIRTEIKEINPDIILLATQVGSYVHQTRILDLK